VSEIPETVLIIHERGLLAHTSEESRHLAAAYALRPVARIRRRTAGETEMTLSLKGEVLEFEVTDLYSKAGGSGDVPLMYKMFALGYDVGATLYHCRKLARVYAGIVLRYEQLRSTLGPPESEGDSAQFGSHGEAYYELDALLSAARRVYDKIGACVWQAFERKGDMPENVGEMLDRFQNVPAQLLERLRRSWTETGVRLKDYRDCTQHFASTDRGLEDVTMHRVAPGVWSAWAQIPDNPEAKSKVRFTYHQGRDALTYGWEVANEVLSLMGQSIGLAIEVRPR
jgi:hypothetical protein